MGAWSATHSLWNREDARSISSMGLRVAVGCGYGTPWAWRSPCMGVDGGPMGPPGMSQRNDAPIYEARSPPGGLEALYVGAL